ncbi:MAG: S8 family serine peptidase, partial [Hymenobacteraceae bacterium]|nr:S8 family serine peptidase [Hymenobacteraceae bacterium]MDX5396380.1 S8 family serine peptidase [Hymenobacteraceae bacterium]MDX5512442.1 S8 family serine peptidase [Hymenobacteraceae bacterium]
GNSAVDCSYSSPARVNATGVYTVSGMDKYGALWANSNYGAPVDYAAPAVYIHTTDKNGGYMNGAGGTSYAAPHVAGLLALKGNNIRTNGYITGDKDSKADPIASL